MTTLSRSLLFALCLLSAPLQAADPPPAAAAAKDTAPPAAAGEAPKDAAAPAPDAPLVPQIPATPAAPEPALLARFEAKTLPADVIKLGGDAEPFLARYLAGAAPEAKGAVLVLPAPGHLVVDDPLVAALLAVLPPGGWSVIAVQTPLLPATAQQSEYDALHDQALARAKAGLEHLAKQQAPPAVVVVGRGASVDLAREVARDAGQVTAVAAIGPWAGTLGEDKLPLLDLAPDRDRRELERANARQQEAKRAGLEGYKLTVLHGADRRLVGFEEEIARRIRGFGEHLPAPAKDGGADGAAPPPAAGGKAPANL